MKNDHQKKENNDLSEMLNVRLFSVSRPSLSSVARHFPPNLRATRVSQYSQRQKTFSPHIFSLHIFSFPEISFPISGDPPAAVSPPFSPKIFRPISSSGASFRCQLFHFPFSGGDQAPLFQTEPCPHFPANLLPLPAATELPVSTTD